ncbi:hypothetical protein C7M84_005009 [Penaeus vannamei]|uniref:Uncharacterized protein n=1 Tax=Penaeus vannamei TaxID=6689 RepID=A0A3R7SV00_PENVA|nr:hypothetical protein C7M84_005009 [Penaeus vannamei]
MGAASTRRPRLVVGVATPLLRLHHAHQPHRRVGTDGLPALSGAHARGEVGDVDEREGPAHPDRGRTHLFCRRAVPADQSRTSNSARDERASETARDWQDGRQVIRSRLMQISPALALPWASWTVNLRGLRRTP